MAKKIKMVCYGVRKTEKLFFETLNKNYGYDLTLIEEYWHWLDKFTPIIFNLDSMISLK